MSRRLNPFSREWALSRSRKIWGNRSPRIPGYSRAHWVCRPGASAFPPDRHPAPPSWEPGGRPRWSLPDLRRVIRETVAETVKGSVVLAMTMNLRPGRRPSALSTPYFSAGSPSPGSCFAPARSPRESCVPEGVDHRRTPRTATRWPKGVGGPARRDLAAVRNFSVRS